MAVYLVTWDLNKEGVEYQRISKLLHTRLASLQTAVRDPGLDTVYFVSTHSTPEQLYNQIVTGILDSNDRIILSRMRDGEYFGHMGTGIWPWIKAHL